MVGITPWKRVIDTNNWTTPCTTKMKAFTQRSSSISCYQAHINMQCLQHGYINNLHAKRPNSAWIFFNLDLIDTSNVIVPSTVHIAHMFSY